MKTKRSTARKGRPRRPAPKILPDDLHDYANEPDPTARLPREPGHLLAPDGRPMRVIDDWPDEVPITEAEIRVFERWFSDVFDEMFGGFASDGILKILSDDDKEKP
jgi:hypothetical protein